MKKSQYEKIKLETPEKLQQWRKTAYDNFKENNPDKLAEMRRVASRKYYETHKAEVSIRRKAKRLENKTTDNVDETLVGSPLGV